LTGQYELTYPTSEAGVGDLSGDAPLAVPGTDELVFNGQYGFAVTDATGHLIRILKDPGADDGYGCRPAEWSSPGVLLAACEVGTEGDTYDELFQIPVSGAPVSGIGLARGRSITELGFFGYDDAWNFSGGMLGLAGNSCGPDTIVQFDTDGRPSPLDVAMPAGLTRGTLRYISHDGDTVTVLNQSGTCNSLRNSLINYDAGTGTSITLLGPGSNGGTVNDALAF
jgi:hypothetical protein